VGRYAGFGGETPIDSACDGDMRFLWGAQTLAATASPHQSSLDRAWAMLTRLQGESNRWGIIHDVRNLRMHFRTNETPQARFVDFGSFDFSPATPALVMDINENLTGDVSNRSEPLTCARNRDFIARFRTEVDGGGEYNRVTKPRVIVNSARFIETLDARW
jgi:hypothetical protein